jgi:hypothetical protein
MYYTLNRAGDMTPVCRIERRADGPWEVFSGVSMAAGCLEPLEGAHELCMRLAMAEAAERAVERLAAKGLKAGG